MRLSKAQRRMLTVAARESGAVRKQPRGTKIWGPVSQYCTQGRFVTLVALMDRDLMVLDHYCRDTQWATYDITDAGREALANTPA